MFADPAEIARLADVIDRVTASWSWSPLTVACASEIWPGRGRGDRHRGRGVLRFGPPKTRAGRRTVGLPWAVVAELAAHLPGSGDPEAFVSTARRVGAAGDRLPRSRLAWRCSPVRITRGLAAALYA
jgi:hypothetical protein